jgi:hypothetical protein
MKQKKFYDIGQAQNYLTGSIIKINNEPVYILDVSSRMILSFVDIENYGRSDKSQSIKITDSNVDMGPIHLGLINLSNPFNVNNNIYISYRLPIRQSRIGLITNNIMILDEHRKIITEKGRIIFSKGMKNTMKNIYPSFTKAIEKINNNEIKNIAFSKRFYISKDRKLYYIFIDTPVGEIKENKIKLKTPFLYLTEMLEEDIKNVA